MIKIGFRSQEFFVPQRIKKYINQFGIGDWEIEIAEKRKFEAVIVIPVLSEFENLPKLIESINSTEKEKSHHFLICFVVNNSNLSSQNDIEDNQKSLKFLRNLINSNSTFNFAVIDASSEGKMLPEKEGGVGFARKIGMDLSLLLLDYQSNMQKFLVCLDSDCTISRNYFTQIYNSVNRNKIKAGYIQFEHPSDIYPFDLAIVNYEIFLRYYKFGMQFANSPFAFFTIGSTMISDFDAYISVDGMNKRKAAEDFYFMEKLSKKYKIHSISDVKVFPSPRGSHRVPFGTGQRVNRFLRNETNEFLLYSVKSFEILKKWNSIFLTQKIELAEYYLLEAEKIHAKLKEFLIEQKFAEAWENITANSGDENQINKQKIFWFDAFRTLKLIHFLRDNAFPDENTISSLNKLFEFLKIHQDGKSEYVNIPTKENLFPYLQKLREME